MFLNAERAYSFVLLVSALLNHNYVIAGGPCGIQSPLFRSRDIFAVFSTVCAFTSLPVDFCWGDSPAMIRCGSANFEDIKYIGSGGSGEVFSGHSYALSADVDGNVVIKKSWERSASSVARECEVLRQMENFNVDGVEKCLKLCSMQTNDASVDSGRQTIIKVPFFKTITGQPPVGDFQDIRSKSARIKAANKLTTTLVEMLAAGVATSDLQPLIDASTGELLLVDMSEAVQFSTKVPSNGDMLAIQNFISEVSMLLASDDELMNEARKAVHMEISKIQEIQARSCETNNDAGDEKKTTKAARKGYLSPAVIDLLHRFFEIEP
jgi:hypothetical protein